ncbi:MAG: NADH-quinone oxidoreductase subunit D, partial [Deltaproteobacteria bacterium]
MSETAQASGGFYTEDMTISVGPQHPSTHGVLRFVVKTDGEVISEAIPDVGYLHRSIEKIGEKVTYHGYVPYTDRADYLAAMFANQAFCLAAEKLAGTEVTRRGEFCRVIACELNRIASHLISVVTFGQDIGAMTPFVHALRERETINNLMEEICGARLTYNYIRIGGVGYDIFPETCTRIGAFLDHFEPIVGEFNRLLSGNKIFIERLAGVAVVSKEDAFSYNLVGPNLRGSGIKWDIRRDIPYSIYPELDFEVPVGTAQVGALGDS